MPKKSKRSRPIKDNDETNYIQRLFHSVFRKFLPDWSDVVDFSKKSGINVNTLRDIYYKEGQAGINTINRVLKSLLSLTPEKVDTVIEMIQQAAPVSEATRIWNSIDTTEDKRKYYALVAKAVWEIDQTLEKDGKDKKV